MPSKKRMPLKGLPDFHTISDEKLKSFKDLAQQLIFSYSHDVEKVRVLEEIWHDLNDEDSDRVPVIEEVVEEGATANILRKVPKLRSSPVKKKI